MDRYARSFTARWADCDVNGHMRNTAYSEYATDLRIGFLAEHGFPFDRFVELGCGPVILHESLDYLREVRLGQTVEVDLALIGLSADGSRFRFRHDVWLPGAKQAARVVLEGGWLDLRLRKLRLPPAELDRAMRAAPRGEPFEELKSLARQRA